MTQFTNQAQLTYNGVTLRSNIVTGEISDSVSVTKNALTGVYTRGGRVTYAVSIVNEDVRAYDSVIMTDDLGAYTSGGVMRYPLNYTDGSLLVLVNGVVTSAAVSADTRLIVTGFTLPAGGSAVIIYSADVTEYAPLTEGSTIENTVLVRYAPCMPEISASEVITVSSEPELIIRKTASPTVLGRGDTITYVFTLENYGNTPTGVGDSIILSDVFDPVLRNISVTYNGSQWLMPYNYTYSETTGIFTTAPGQITVPAATYSQNPVTGIWTVTPGSVSVTLSGTV